MQCLQIVNNVKMMLMLLLNFVEERVGGVFHGTVPSCMPELVDNRLYECRFISYIYFWMLMKHTQT